MLVYLVGWRTSVEWTSARLRWTRSSAPLSSTRSTPAAASRRPRPSLGWLVTFTHVAGIDLAWGSGPAQVWPSSRRPRAPCSRRPRCTPTRRSRTSLLRMPPTLATVAVDAPLIVTNPTGQRPCEREIGAVFGQVWRGRLSREHRRNPHFNPPRAATLAAAFGWNTDPAHPGRPGAPSCIEVYPHPAMVGLLLPALHAPLQGQEGARPRQPPGGIRGAPGLHGASPARAGPARGTSGGRLCARRPPARSVSSSSSGSRTRSTPSSARTWPGCGPIALVRCRSTATCRRATSWPRRPRPIRLFRVRGTGLRRQRRVCRQAHLPRWCPSRATSSRISRVDLSEGGPEADASGRPVCSRPGRGSTSALTRSRHAADSEHLLLVPHAVELRRQFAVPGRG